MSLILSVSVKVGLWSKIKDRIGMTSINIITLRAKLRSVIVPVCLCVCGSALLQPARVCVASERFFVDNVFIQGIKTF